MTDNTPTQYNGFEHAWMFDDRPIFDPTEAMLMEDEGVAENPGIAGGIGWSDRTALSYDADHMGRNALVDKLRQYADLVVKRDKTGKWPQMLLEAAAWLDGDGDTPYWTTFQKGNTKLPFYEWSVIAAGTCPGAGECLNFCYSIKFWFRAMVFQRQLMNTLLIRFYPDIVRAQFMKLNFGDAEPYMRLYVHGDFTDLKSVEFWMDTIALRPDVNVYCYSKSWKLLLDYDEKYGGVWPENFTLNLSSGSKYGEDMRRKMMNLACTRGDFVAIMLTSEEKKLINELESGEAGRRELLDIVSMAREKLSPDEMQILGDIRKMALSKVLQKRYAGTGEKFFACPGFCATCTRTSGGKFAHACGSRKFDGIKIAIGVH